MTEAEKQHRAVEAHRILNEPLLQEAMNVLGTVAFEELIATTGTTPEDERKRLALIQNIHVLRGIKQHLELVIAQGKASAKHWKPA